MLATEAGAREQFKQEEASYAADIKANTPPHPFPSPPFPLPFRHHTHSVGILDPLAYHCCCTPIVLC